MPWQRMVADVAGEILPDTGALAYREVWVIVMRQSGKTTWELATEVDRCVSWKTAQRVVFTAQNGWEAKTKLLEDHVPLIESSPLGKLITPAGGGRIRRAQGDWGVNFGGGSKIDVLGSSKDAGHGRTIDLGVLDEAWKDEDDRREQALLPAMITKPWAQLIGSSTMGTEASTYLNRKVEAGRHWAVEDPGAGIAYFEFSVPDDEDIDDPEVWLRYMPALCPDEVCRCGDGLWRHTQTIAAVQHARQTMDESEFRRAMCNQRTTSGERVIPADLWDAVQDPQAVPGDSPRFALDVDRERGTWAVAVCDDDGQGEVLPTEGRPVEWFGAKQSRLTWTVVIDDSGPASPVGDELEDLGVTVIRRKRGEVADDCGRLYDAVADGKIRVRPTSQALDEAVAGVAKKPSGDKFVWSRATSAADVTPLMALSLAFGPQEKSAEPRIRRLGA